MKMILRLLLLYCYLPWTNPVRINQKVDMSRLSGTPLRNGQPDGDCLTGYMTDVQSWVDANGALNMRFTEPNSSIDMSNMSNPVPMLQHQMEIMRSSRRYVRFLSLASCNLTRVPLVFQFQDYKGRYLSDTVEYMTFYGNTFISISSPGQEYDVTLNATGAAETTVAANLLSQQQATLVWSSSLQASVFPVLKELDLRACSIQVLNPNLFSGMRNLEALYIGENAIYHIDADAFTGLDNLIHLDLSWNHPNDEVGNPKNLVSDSFYIFSNLTNLVSLDLSHTRLTPRNFGMIRGLGKRLKSLSLCGTGLMNIGDDIFENTSLEILDISRNNGILGAQSSLKGIENTLVVLNARETGLQTMEMLKDFKKLEVLQLSNNEITGLRSELAKTLKSLQVLDLNKNRMTSWFNNTFSLMPKLRFLALKDNNINLITEPMIEDLSEIDYLALSGNFVVCNCHAKDLYKMAAYNEEKFKDTKLKPASKTLYNTGFDVYNKVISIRNTVKYDCGNESCETTNITGQFRLVDYWHGGYTCLKVPESKSMLFSDVVACNVEARDKLDYDELKGGRYLLLVLIIIPCVLLPMLFIFVFRRNLRYCLITMRNSATLSLINKNEGVDGTIFNYDVFVSYCNEDRGWVLDHLLPHMEAECSISACLHERDFQVGLSILENIVSCMDRSRSIMLIISQRFLLSQWCQFEMHLAQHRLLETRREDLILVLLEDIPRRLRPTTLHYLMLTKTYIVWPKVSSERSIFWRRMKKSLMSQKSKYTENVSLA
ncbi:uncharacterized protein LOC142984912 isoform X2 [Anticarsia gemmatalis]|uniref:uncharacterized protein LOC142984912 isoform X2 n=1 Tax=Anticarsia gemmatalis TaxID=129554 RepID=UPI003F7723CF